MTASVLTDRQLECLRLKAAGLTYDEVAAKLFVSVAGVRDLLARVRMRLGASDTTHAVALAYEAGLLVDEVAANHGPDVRLNALPSICRRAGWELLAASRQDGWRRDTVDAALHELAAEIHRLQDEVAAVRVDRDRGTREATRRAEDCEAHGADLREAYRQVHYFSSQADVFDQERRVWLSAAEWIRGAFANRDDELSRAIVAYLDAASGDADRARKRHAYKSIPPDYQGKRRCRRCGLMGKPGDPHHPTDADEEEFPPSPEGGFSDRMIGEGRRDA